MPLAPVLFALLLDQTPLEPAARAGRASAVDPAVPGPKIGEQAPDFSAPDQDGRERSLASLMGPKGLMLVFYRSAEW